MSDKLNEKFVEFATEQKVTIVEGDPMPPVSANVIPGTGSEPSQVSDAQTSSGTGKLLCLQLMLVNHMDNLLLQI